MLSDFTVFNPFLDSAVAVSIDQCPISAAAQEQDKDLIYINSSASILHNENKQKNSLVESRSEVMWGKMSSNKTLVAIICVSVEP